MPPVNPIRSKRGDHGGSELVRQGMGCSGQTVIQHNRCCGVPQRNHHPDERGGTLEGFDRIRPRLQHRNRRHRAPALPAKWTRGLDSRKASWATVAGDTGGSSCPANCCRDTTAGLGVRLQRLVAGSVERAFAQGNRHWLQRRSTGADHETGRVLVPAPQAHDEGQARRSGVPEGRSEAAQAQKKRSSTTLILR
jgi:hypothetical protein